MNFKVMPERWQCEKCGKVQAAGNNYCRGCGVSFVYGLDDAEWKHETEEQLKGVSTYLDMAIDAVGKWLKAN